MPSIHGYERGLMIIAIDIVNRALGSSFGIGTVLSQVCNGAGGQGWRWAGMVVKRELWSTVDTRKKGHSPKLLD